VTAGFLDIAGARLEYRRVAPKAAVKAAQAPEIVLLHEGLGSVAMWRDFPDRLAEAAGRSVFAYSRAGYGRSSPVALPRPARYMHDEALATLPRVLEAAGIAECVLVGHSDGGSIALIYAGGVRPMKARGVVTLAAHVFNEKLCVDSIAAAGRAYLETDLRRRLARYHADVDNAFRGWNDVWLSPEFWHWNIEEYLPRVAVPVLAIQGRDDEYGTARQVDAIVAQVKGRAEKLMLPKCKHSPHRDQPAMTLEAIARFVAAL
jgi:pimeloyl-ACP methyl ester carboxylesterase